MFAIISKFKNAEDNVNKEKIKYSIRTCRFVKHMSHLIDIISVGIPDMIICIYSKYFFFGLSHFNGLMWMQ